MLHPSKNNALQSIMQALLSLSDYRKLFVLREYSIDENPDITRYEASRLFSKVWIDNFRPSLTYHKEKRESMDLEYLYPYLKKLKFKENKRMDAALLFNTLMTQLVYEMQPSVADAIEPF